MEPDDSIFISLIKGGIEGASGNDRTMYDELLKHAVKEYADIRLKYARDDEDEFDADLESEKAKNS